LWGVAAVVAYFGYTYLTGNSPISNGIAGATNVVPNAASTDTLIDSITTGYSANFAGDPNS
jgi:hypothetical protein